MARKTLLNKRMMGSIVALSLTTGVIFGQAPAADGTSIKAYAAEDAGRATEDAQVTDVSANGVAGNDADADAPAPRTEIVVKPGVEIDGHEYLNETTNYRLYLNKSDLSVVVEDKATGAYMESSVSYDDGRNNDMWLGAMKSAVVLTMINNNSDTTQADLVNDDNTVNLKITDDGFSAEIYWTRFKIGVTLNVSMTDEGLVASIPEESIREDGTQYYIGTLRIYPYMGGSYLDDKEGYLFIPDGNGALVYLNDKEGRFSSGFSGTIYGTDVGFEESMPETLLWDRYSTVTDSEEVFAPIYGIAHTGDGMAYLGIVEEGEERASIDVMPNGVSIDYNRAYARFVLRRTYNQPTSASSTSGSLHVYEDDRSHSDLQVRFIFLSGDDATYAGMANAYREYLLEAGEIARSDSSYHTRVDFLGTEREEWLLSTTAVVMTTIEDVRDILTDLGANGVTGLTSIYKGWQKGGLYNLPISKYKADRKIGSTSELTSLIKDQAATGNNLYLYDNALLVNPDEQNATFNTIKRVNKRRYEETKHAEVYDTFMYLTPERTGYLLDKFTRSYASKGVNGLCLSGMTSDIFTYTYSNVKHTRFETAARYEEAVGAIAPQLNLVMEQPCEYLWKYTGAFMDMPLYTSNYILEDESIPFLSMVLKGVMPMYGEYVNFEANKQEFFLKMIESGVYPSFYVTRASSADLIYTNSSDVYSSEYTAFKDTIIRYDGELRAFGDKTAGACITDHRIEGDLRYVEYSNGVKVYLNYGSKTAEMDGVTVEPMDYVLR